MRTRRGLALAGALMGVVAACANLSGLSGGGVGDGGAQDGTSGAPDAAGGADAAPDAAGCPDGFAADPHNCGACGHDCLGGACSDGGCQPVVLASGEADPVAVATDDAGVYWADYGTSTATPVQYGDGRIVRAARDGSGATTLAGNDGSQPFSRSVHSDGSFIYWLNASSPARVWRIPNTGGSVQTLADSENVLSELAVDSLAGLVFWSQWQNSAGVSGDIFSTKNAPGSAIATLSTVTDGEPIGIALDSAYVYYTTVSDTDGGTDGVHRIPRGGCPGASECATLVAPACFAPVVASDDANVYWVDTCAGAIYELSVNGGTPGNLGTPGGYPGALAFDDLWVYWTDWNDTSNTGTVARARKDYSNSQVLAVGQNHPAGIAVDATAVYWVNQGTDTGSAHFDNHDGQVLRLALPPGN